MEAAWAPRLRKPLKTCCGSAAIMDHNTALSETPAREKDGNSKLPNGPPQTLYWGSWGWGVTFRLGGVGLLVGFVGFVFKDLASSPNRCFSRLSLILLI